MASQVIKEVNAPYTISPDDQAIGQDTIVIQRNGKPIAVVIPYDEYARWIARGQGQSPTAGPTSPDFERERAAFYRLLPELLKEHRGEWVAIVDEQPVEFGPNFNSVITRVYETFGQRTMYVQEVLEQPRVYKMGSPRVVRQ
jgi:hypothetical protein